MTMPDPVRAWAAVAPDGQVWPDMTRRREDDVWNLIIERWGRHISSTSRRSYARQAGWRVVPVKIVPMEGK